MCSSCSGGVGVVEASGGNGADAGVEKELQWGGGCYGRGGGGRGGVEVGEMVNGGTDDMELLKEVVGDIGDAGI